MKIIIIFSMLVVMFGCATTLSDKGEKVIETDSKSVINCKYVKFLTGSKWSGILMVESGLEDARAQVKNKAARLNATHIIWESTSTGITQTVTGKAYKCN